MKIVQSDLGKAAVPLCMAAEIMYRERGSRGLSPRYKTVIGNVSFR